MQKIEHTWSLSIEEAFEALEVSDSGLASDQVDKRRFTYGPNIFKKREQKNPLLLFLKQFLSPLIFLLIGASCVTMYLDEWFNTAFILFAVFLNVLLGFYHEYHAENTLAKLTTYIKDRSLVIRDGREVEIDSADLVPGDVIKLSYGARVPADARILSTNGLRVDEAILTGESVPIQKNTEPVHIGAAVMDRQNIAHAGTLVVEGYATALVYATGDDTEIGKIAHIVSSVERTKTPLQKGIDKLAWLIFILVLILVVGIWMLGISRGEPALPMLILSTAIAVGAVPEALPIVLTMILAIGATRIAQKKGVVRKLAAAETLGSATLVMTDKTGTLTMADMQLVSIYSFDRILIEDTIEKHFSHEDKKILEYALNNIDVTVENIDASSKEWVFRGRPFEINIAKACIKEGLDIAHVLTPGRSMVLPFNSTNKFSVADAGDTYSVMGAPDILLRRSKVSKDNYIKIEEWIEKISRAGYRIIGIANMSKQKAHIKPEQVEHLEFLGVLLFYDPIRKEVPKAIKNIEAHGVQMVLVTGDLVGTALSVAKNLDWAVAEDQVLLGADLRQMSDEELLRTLPSIKIFARVTPEDKLRIGMLYQKLGEVVAMTGDGVNDAPALKAADIGISLGSGSDVAKSAADLVLLDDNFETISLAIDEGRKILNNVRKSFVYLMSNSLDAVFVVTGSLLFAMPMPLTALQIIWVNLFTGSLPALAFAFDEDVEREKTKFNKNNIVFTPPVKVLTFGIGLLSSLLLFVLYYLLEQTTLASEVVRTIFFVCFASYVLVVSYSFRSLSLPIYAYNIFSNKKLNWSILIAVIVLLLTILVPFLRDVFEIAPLPIAWVPFILLWLCLNILLVEGAKYAMRKTKHLF
ncbi:MAG: cation-translocating P-type ATPase [Candidatus Paceibacterota bacterium]